MQAKLQQWNPIVYKDMVKWYQIFYTPRNSESKVWRKKVLVDNIPLEIIQCKGQSSNAWSNFILFLESPTFENEEQVENFATKLEFEVIKPYFSTVEFSFMIDNFSPLQNHLLKTAQKQFCNSTYESFGMFLNFKTNSSLAPIPSIPSQFQVTSFTSDKELFVPFYTLFLETFGVPTQFIQKEIQTLIHSTQFELTHRVIILDTSKSNTVVATLSYTFNEEAKNTFLNEITVEKSYRKQGLGYFITIYALHQMQQLYPQIEGVSLNATVSGFPIYEKMGFVYTSPIIYCQKYFC